MNKVAVILLHYQEFDDTKECVRSIFESENIEPSIVIVDNSQPNDKRLDSLAAESDRIKLIYSDTNLGFSNGNNLGINWALKQPQFDYFLILNNDTTIEKSTIFGLTDSFKTDKKIGVSTCKIVYQSNPEIIWYGGADMDYRKGWPRIADFNTMATKNGADQSRFVEFVSGCAMMFSRSSLEDVGGFEKNFFMYCEDMELSLRAMKKGWKLYYNHEEIVYHKVQGASNSEDSRVKRLHPKNPNAHFLFYHMKPNQYFTMKKYLSAEQFRHFRRNFWMRFIYFNILMMFYARFSVVKTTIRTVRRIKELTRLLN